MSMQKLSVDSQLIKASSLSKQGDFDQAKNI